MRWILALLLCGSCLGGDSVTVIIDGQRIVIVNGEEIIRRHGEQKGMSIIYDRAKMVAKAGERVGRIIE